MGSIFTSIHIVSPYRTQSFTPVKKEKVALEHTRQADTAHFLRPELGTSNRGNTHGQAIH